MQDMNGNRRQLGSHDPFAGFGFGSRHSFFSDFFDRDPFDDPFFTRPFGSFFQTDRFFEPFKGHQGMPSLHGRQDGQQGDHTGPVIEEIDDEDQSHGSVSETKHNPIVEHPDDDFVPHSSGHTRGERSLSKLHHFPKPSRNFTQSYSYSSVTYGGPGGAYYTKSSTRRTGADGLVEEHHEERDSRTGNETNSVLHGLGNKGHAVIRKRNAEGENYLETLHNLTEEEKGEFDQTWLKQAEKLLPGWNKSGGKMLEDGHRGGGKQKQSRAALPSSKDSPWRWPWAKQA